MVALPIRAGGIFERGIETVAFDNLTQGKGQLASASDAMSINNGTPITLVNHEHPVSRAIVRFAQQRLLGKPAASSAVRPNRRDKRKTA